MRNEGTPQWYIRVTVREKGLPKRERAEEGMKEKAKHLFGEVHASENIPSEDFLRETANNERNCLFKPVTLYTSMLSILQNGFLSKLLISELFNEQKCND